MRGLIALSLIAVLAAPAAADVAAKISGPKTAATDEILELTAEIEGDSSDFRLRPRPSDLRERYTEDGLKCYLWLPVKGVTYEAELLVVGVVEGKAKIATAYHEVKIEDDPKPPTPPGPPSPPSPNPPSPNPPTPPGPNPPPQPLPGPEDGRFGMAVLTYNAAKAVNRPAEAVLLAGAFRKTAQETRDENLGILSILSRLRKNTAVVPDESKSYWQGCNDLLSSKLKSLYSAGKLSTANDWAECFEEIARGLEAAGK